MTIEHTIRKTALFFITLCLTAAAGRFPAAAAEDNMIKKVRLRLTVSGFDESTGKPVLAADSAGSCYEVSGIQESDTEREWYEIELAAEADCTFDIMEQNDIKVTGVRNSCVKAVRKNGGETLVLTVIPEGLEQIMGEVGQPEFSGCTVQWKAADNAASYLVLLYRNSARVGQTHRTAGTSYDFSPLMTEPGIYECKIFPLSVKDKKGTPAQTARKMLGGAEAEKNREQLLQTVGGMEGKVIDGMEGKVIGGTEGKVIGGMEGGMIGGAKGEGWIQDESGWRYIQKDGTWPQNNWLRLNDGWYYFDGEGNMVTDSWEKWKGEWYYLGSSGLMEERES